MDKIKAFAISLTSFITGWLGALAIPIFILLGCNLIDYYTGISAAPFRNSGSERPVKSYKSIKGINKKICMYLLIIIGFMVDKMITYSLSQIITVAYPPIFALVITCWLIFNEIISILENMDDMGVKIPPFLLPIMKKIKGSIEEPFNDVEDALDENEDE